MVKNLAGFRNPTDLLCPVAHRWSYDFEMTLLQEFGHFRAIAAISRTEPDICRGKSL